MLDSNSINVSMFNLEKGNDRMFFKITFRFWSVYRKHCGGLTPDAFWFFYMMRTVYHLGCILFLGRGIIIENFQGCGQGIQNLSKNNTGNIFVFMLANVCLWKEFYLAALKSLTAFGSWFMKLLPSWEQSGCWPKRNGCMKGYPG